MAYQNVGTPRFYINDISYAKSVGIDITDVGENLTEGNPFKPTDFPLEDYHKLIDSTQDSLKLKGNLEMAIKELQVFLSFLCTRENIEKHVEEFNRQSKTSVININGGIAKIELKK